MPKADALLERIKTFRHAGRDEVVVRKVARGYSLFSARTGAPIARLRPTGEADMVQVLWWNGERWGGSYQRPQLVTGLAHSRRVMEAIRSGMAMSAFQAWQQVSTIAA
jgi:hypothetical protein